MIRDEDDAYEALREACDRGDGCPRCMTTIPWLIQKLPTGPTPFACLSCGFTFHGWIDAFRTVSA